MGGSDTERKFGEGGIKEREEAQEGGVSYDRLNNGINGYCAVRGGWGRYTQWGRNIREEEARGRTDNMRGESAERS